ncbi:MAG: hypothetical protein M5U21_11710 [Fimbriimonadaceae bacterium]|nr:hypothetical protein [Fimbriimonadaceae bacterium]
MAVRHIVAVGIIVGTGVGLFHLRSALNGTGEWMPWVRDIFVNVFWPVFNGFLFAGYMKLLKGQEDVVGTA